jgi:hypothetical protein
VGNHHRSPRPAARRGLQVDLAFNPFEPRDRKGRWTDTAISNAWIEGGDIFRKIKAGDREVAGAFDAMLKRQPRSSGPLYRGTTTPGAGNLQPGTILERPRPWSSTSNLTSAVRYGQSKESDTPTIYRINTRSARVLPGQDRPGTMREAVIPPGRFRVTGVTTEPLPQGSRMRALHPNAAKSATVIDLEDVTGTDDRSFVAQVTKTFAPSKPAKHRGRLVPEFSFSTVDLAFNPKEPRDERGRWTRALSYGLDVDGPKFRAIGARLDGLIDRAKSQGLDTETLYRGKTPGRYSRQRAALHREIVRKVLREAEREGVPKDRKAVVTGGLGGSGKGYNLEKYEQETGAKMLHVDPDAMKEELLRRGAVPEVKGLHGLEMAALLHEESSHLSKMLLARASAEGYNLASDTTMASYDSAAKRVQSLRDQGYTVSGMFSDIPIEESVKSAAARYLNGRGTDLGGRYVAPRIIRANAPSQEQASLGYWSQNRAVFERLKANGLFDGGTRRYQRNTAQSNAVLAEQTGGF